jgi:hypothetical protein
MHPFYFPSKLKEWGEEAVPLSIFAVVVLEAAVEVLYPTECCS